jgi:DNA/RNA-binding domain of Phe-tRNA-synthetase-like protein
MFPEFRLSENYQKTYPGVGFGLTLISGCQEAESPEGFAPYRKKLLRKMRKREILAQITQRIETYDAFFQSFGYPCPLTRHLKRTVNSGFPIYSLFVDAHFMAEMCAGILVAVTDADAFDGGLTLDVAKGGETCSGMGGRLFTMQPNEIILQDEKDIVCVLCQGADEKTRVNESSTNILFYAYAVPGIDKEHLEYGLTLAAETLVAFGGGSSAGIKVY